MNTLLYSAAVLWLASGADSPEQPPIPITAKVGSSVVLPCEWKDALSSSPHIEWRTFSKIVFERRGEEHYEGDGYKDRVDVPEDKLKKGNCSLLFKHFKAEDAGVYRCNLMMKGSLQSKWIFIQSVNLSLNETPEELARGKSPAHSVTGVLISILCLLSISRYFR